MLFINYNTRIYVITYIIYIHNINYRYYKKK